MKYLDEYRELWRAPALAAAIARTVTRPWTIMEVCGGQTHTIVKYGIDRILPAPRSSWCTNRKLPGLRDGQHEMIDQAHRRSRRGPR